MHVCYPFLCLLENMKAFNFVSYFHFSCVFKSWPHGKAGHISCVFISGMSYYMILFNLPSTLPLFNFKLSSNIGCLQTIGRFRSPSTIETCVLTIETCVLVDAFSSAALYTQTHSLHKCHSFYLYVWVRATIKPFFGKFVPSYCRLYNTYYYGEWSKQPL